MTGASPLVCGFRLLMENKTPEKQSNHLTSQMKSLAVCGLTCARRVARQTGTTDKSSKYAV